MKYNRYSKRDAVKNYFPLPNEIFCLDLSAGEIAVYAYLMYCEDRKTFQCYPSYKTIGSAVGLSKNTVKKYIDGLVAKQLITTEPTTVITKKGQKHNGTLLYTIRLIQEAVEYRFQRQLTHFEAEMYRQKVLKKLENFDRKQGSKIKPVKESGS